MFCAFLLPATLMCGCVQSKPAWVCTPGLSPQQTDAGMLTVSWSKVPPWHEHHVRIAGDGILAYEDMIL